MENSAIVEVFWGDRKTMYHLRMPKEQFSKKVMEVDENALMMEGFFVCFNLTFFSDVCNHFERL